MFFTCKQVSDHLSKEDYDKLPAFQKFTLKFHVLFCPICGKYNRQVMKFQDMARTFREKEEEFLETDNPGVPHMESSAKDRLKEKMEQAQKEAAESASSSSDVSEETEGKTQSGS